MANQFQTEPRLNPRQSTMRVIAARVNVLRLLSVATVALFLFLGAAHAQTSGPCNTAQSYCLFVSCEIMDKSMIWKWSILAVLVVASLLMVAPEKSSAGKMMLGLGIKTGIRYGLDI